MANQDSFEIFQKQSGLHLKSGDINGKPESMIYTKGIIFSGLVRFIVLKLHQNNSLSLIHNIPNIKLRGTPKNLDVYAGYLRASLEYYLENTLLLTTHSLPDHSFQGVRNSPLFVNLQYIEDYILNLIVTLTHLSRENIRESFINICNELDENFIEEFVEALNEYMPSPEKDSLES